MSPNTPMSFIAAMKHFFGFKAGQTLGEFSAELKTLDANDRAYFRKGLIANGYTLTDA